MMRLTLSLLAACAGQGVAWSHSWDTAGDAWWGYGGMAGNLLKDEQVAFVAKTYQFVTLSLCPGGSGFTTSGGVRNISSRLKALNPNIKVLLYYNTQQWPCYVETDPDYATFLAHPEWWLRDDNGATVEPKRIDYTNEQAVEYWLSVPLAGSDGVDLIDGVLADGAAVYDALPNISVARNEELKAAKYRMVGRLQQQFSKANGGLVLANGMTGGPIDPNAPQDHYNLAVLNFTDGIENEHFAVFEQVDGTTGELRKDAVAANLAAIEQAGAVANSSKVVAMNFWPGPIVGFDQDASSANHGNPVFAPGDPHNSNPNGTQAEVWEAWQKQQLKYLPFNLASFLMVAGPRTYFTQMVWYATNQGFVPCPEAPVCAGPTPWYPDMSTPLGPPTGPRAQLGPYKWQRTFAHAVVTLDLDEPLGPGTAITWSSSASVAV